MKLRLDTRGLLPSSCLAGSHTARWQADPTKLPSIPTPWDSPCMCPGHGPCLQDSQREALVHRQGQPSHACGTISDQDGTHMSLHSESCQPWADTRGTAHFQLILSLHHSRYNGEGGTGLPWCLVTRTRQFFCTGSFWLKEQQAEPTVDCPPGVTKTQKPQKEVKSAFLEHGNAEEVLRAPATREVQRAAEIP